MNPDIDYIINNNKLVKLPGGVIVSEGILATLNKFDIKIDNCQTLNDVIFLITDFINNTDDLTDEEFDELDNVSAEIAERNYYLNTNK